MIKPGTSTKLPQSRPNAPPPSRTPLLIGLSAGALVLVGGAFWAMTGSTPPEQPPIVRPPDPPPRKPIVEDPPKEKPEEPQLKEAREAMEAARAKSKSAPADLEAQRVAWDLAARNSALTPYFKEASTELQRSKTSSRPPNLRAPEAGRETRGTAGHQASGGSDRDADAVERRDGESERGDFEGAAADLRKEEAGKAEADELLKARFALIDARGEISRMKAGEPIALNYRSDLGDRKRVEGVLQRAWVARLEIRQGEETVFVEISDICRRFGGRALQAVGDDAAPLRAALHPGR